MTKLTLLFWGFWVCALGMIVSLFYAEYNWAGVLSDIFLVATVCIREYLMFYTGMWKRNFEEVKPPDDIDGNTV